MAEHPGPAQVRLVVNVKSIQRIFENASEKAVSLGELRVSGQLDGGQERGMCLEEQKQWKQGSVVVHISMNGTEYGVNVNQSLE
jgi:hypothetical protein